ncbi:hypothetical protein [Sulfurimonas sp.]|uniref:hypothetical protein n=1 Tax=Sulfurimonas sp. TaxID=2022749 RepID=UPI0025EE5740|nr:hypothetical protein [Sulfurimonas sp.]MDD5156686.1 hypothetical protein [Sulfurimonas sp.]
MNIYKTVVGSLLVMSSLHANDSLSSELSHFAGGAVMAGGITAVVDVYYPEYRSDRGMIGFGISSAAIVVEQGVEFILNGNAKGQLLDVVSHIAGSAFGVYITDRYILTPVIKDCALEGKYIGLVMQHSF